MQYRNSVRFKPRLHNKRDSSQMTRCRCRLASILSIETSCVQCMPYMHAIHASHTIPELFRGFSPVVTAEELRNSRRASLASLNHLPSATISGRSSPLLFLSVLSLINNICLTFASVGSDAMIWILIRKLMIRGFDKLNDKLNSLIMAVDIGRHRLHGLHRSHSTNK